MLSALFSGDHLELRKHCGARWSHAHVNRLHPAAIANLLTALPRDDRDAVWELIDPAKLNEVLAEVEDEIRAPRMLRMQPGELAQTAQDLDIEDAVDFLQDLPADIIDEVLRSMDEQNRRLIETALAYPADTPGGLIMVDDFLTVRADVTLEVVLRYLRAKGELPENTDRLTGVDRDNRHEGMSRLSGLLINPPEAMVSDIMETAVPSIPVLTLSHDVATVFQQFAVISEPVVDDEGCLLGRITFDDVIDVIRDEGEHSLMSMARMDEHYGMFAPVWVTSRKRMLWLGENLATSLAGIMGHRIIRSIDTANRCAGGTDARGCRHERDCQLPGAYRGYSRNGAWPGRAPQCDAPVDP